MIGRFLGRGQLYLRVEDKNEYGDAFVFEMGAVGWRGDFNGCSEGVGENA
jgi:hypothetical protein